jgi:phenylalanine-4-hydroxylase
MEQLPQHLKKYIVQQDNAKYTPIDHAVWRYILRQLKNFLKTNGHESYLEGLEKTGITSEEIPSINELSRNLEKFGWRALPVSGFIPPAAFMELQSLSVLPIASDMRSLDHLLYTPAPDIVHEAAGHAPILIHPEFSNYLKKYAQVAKKALINKEDLELYEAIRVLSDVKENPNSTAEEISQAEARLDLKSKAISYVSEAAELGRMNWWTAEYGLIGDIQKPKIFGAGLLSSVGESKWCLSDKVKKIPLSIDCLKYSYDITEPQPQLFVTPDFKTLEIVLEQMAATMAFKVGGTKGLDKAIKTEVVNTVEIDSLIQIGGQLEKYLLDDQGHLCFIKFKGPTQIAVDEKELPGHDKHYHPSGFSSPMGKLKGINKNPALLSDSEWSMLGIELGKEASLEFQSGFKVQGIYLGRTVQKNKTIILKFKQATASYKSEIMFQPEWGYYDIILGETVSSVFSGPADRIAYGETSDFVAVRVQQPTYSEKQLQIQKLYKEIRYLRQNKVNTDILEASLAKHFAEIKAISPDDWLLPLEMYELVLANFIESDLKKELLNYLLLQKEKLPQFKSSIEDGIELALHS